jgi:type I restriction enzyme S subunit
MSSEVAAMTRASDVMPGDWREVSVADFVAMMPGFAFKSDNFVTDVDAGLPLIRIRDLGQTNTATRYMGSYDQAFAVSNGDILVGMDGSFEAVRWRGGKALLNQRVLKLSSACPSAMDEGYLFYRVQPALVELEQTISGTTVKHLSTKDLRKLVWQLPPLDEQRRIAEVLRSVDDAIAAQLALVFHLRQTADVLADELYAGEIADCDGDLVTYGDACETVQVGIVVKPASYYVDDGGVPALRSTNIKRNAIDYTALVQLSLDGHKISRKSALRAGDVVTIRTGEPGKTAVIAHDAPSPLNCIDVIFSRPKPSLRSYFAAYFINSNTARVQIAAMQGGLAQQHFNVGEMKKLRMPLPSLARQDRIVEVLDAAWQSVRIEEAQLATLRSTKAALMSALLPGHVRVLA